MIASPHMVMVMYAACGVAELAIFGQVGTSLENIAPWGAGLVNLGFVAWLAWYTQTKTIPRLVDNFRDDIRQQHTQFILEISTTRDRFSAELKAEREHCTDHRMKLLDMIVQRRVEQEVKRQEGQA